MKTKIIPLAIVACLLVPSSQVWAESAIVKKMKETDQKQLAEERNKECTMGCRTTRGWSHQIGPDFFAYPDMANGAELSPDQLYLLRRLNDLYLQQTKILQLVWEQKVSAPYSQQREEIKGIVLDMFARVGSMQDVSPNEVKILQEAVRVASNLHLWDDLREEWVKDRDINFAYQYAEGVEKALDRFREDIYKYRDHIPGGHFARFEWGHAFTMNVLKEFHKPLASAYPETVHAWTEKYTVKFLDDLQKDNTAKLDERLQAVLSIYNTYKAMPGTAGKGSLSFSLGDRIIEMIKTNNQTITENERYYQDYAISLGNLYEVSKLPDIAADKKKAMKLQWYRSFMEGLGKLDVPAVYKGNFYWYVNYLVDNDLKLFNAEFPNERKLLAKQLLTKLKEEKNPENKAEYNQTIAKLTKLANGK